MAIVRAVSPRSASAPSTASSATQWLPAMTRSGARASPMSVTLARVSASSAELSASTARKPSACENAVIAPEPFGVGNAIGPSSPAARATRTNSLRPSSDGSRTGTVASSVRSDSGSRPARARITGATNAWKVKIAEVGNPGSTTTGLLLTTARHSGLPGLSATPCTRMPGSPSRATT